MVQHVGRLPDVLLRVGAINVLQDPHCVDLANPVAQVSVGEITAWSRAGHGRDGHGCSPFRSSMADRRASPATDSTAVYRTEGAKATLVARARMMRGGFGAFFSSGRQIATTCTEHILPRVVLHEPAYGNRPTT